MAASMVGCRFGCHAINICKNSIRSAATSSFYVLLPEVPTDTPESNAIMQIDDPPKFSEITPEKVITGCAKLAIDFDVKLGKHVENLNDPNVAKSFENVFAPIEKISVPLKMAWRVAKNLNYVNTDDGYRIAFQRIHPQVERAKNERWLNEPMHNIVKEVKADHRNLNEFQERLVNMYLSEGKLNGIELYGDDKRKFLEFLGKLVGAKNHFRKCVMLSHNMFSHVIEDFDTVVDLPRHLVTQMAVDKSNPSRGPWKATLQAPVYQPMMEHCRHRMLRWNLWQAYNQRASIAQNELNISNHMIIKDIRHYRKDIAQILGFDNYAEMSMETKMAGSVDNVLNMIESLKTKFKSKSVDEISELQEFAQSEGFNHKLEMWDVAFWRRKHRDHLYNIDQAEVAQYFPFSRVLSGVFNICSDLFGIRITDHTSEVDTWHEDVHFYRIHDTQTGEELAGFYLDPFVRPPSKQPGGWVEAGRERSSACGTTPLSFLNLNLPKPIAGKDTVLTTDDLHLLFYEFGHGLQQLLTTVPYSEIGAQRNIEWDALQTSAMVMSRLLFNPHMLTQISYHSETGKQLPEELAESICKARKHMCIYDMMRQLYFSALDMEMYLNDDHWVQTMKNVWKEFMPLDLHEDDHHPCQMTSIFTDQYPAAYYSFKWSEMLAADVYKAFEEAGLDDPEQAAIVGRRYRDTFLSLGGGVPAEEVFRRFRGRDPSMDSLILEYGGSV